GPRERDRQDCNAKPGGHAGHSIIAPYDHRRRTRRNSQKSLVRPRRFAFFVEHSLALPVGAVIALVWANTGGASYRAFADALEFAVNDVGMVFFFGLAA